MERAMHDPVFETLGRIAAVRGRPVEAAAAGLWCCGSLDGLARPCVAIVGTRAATSYGTRLAGRFAAELGRAGCAVISGLALGIDRAAHEGALVARAPTIGVLGGGHRCFFPKRNQRLAEQIVADGGAVLSPYPPDYPAAPHQFLERNGIVAALADAVVVIEAPARSGALNTAGWAAGRIPVLAVPGDVDRKHVAGCLALIRDGATLARSSQDVLEALGHLPLQTLSPVTRDTRDPTASALLRAIEQGAAEFDEIVTVSGIAPSAALAALALLELDGTIESAGASRYARVAALSGGEKA
jgi:DNA processing protein